MASTYTTTESHVRTNEYVVEAVLRLDGIVWDEDKTRVLDYACGGGLVSKVCCVTHEAHKTCSDK